MKESMKILIGTLMAIVIFALLALSLEFILPTLDTECLNKYAEGYCLENNYTDYSYPDGNSRFFCNKDLNDRTRENNQVAYYFIEEEIIDCRIKEWFTFKKLKDVIGENNDE